MSPTCTPEKKQDYKQPCDSNGLYFETNGFHDDFQSETECDSNEEKKQIDNLANLFPQLRKIFFFHKKVGCGTFSTVYLASLKADSTFKKRYAIKHIVPTCHPNRIETELKCLKEIGGVDNVASVEFCLRNKNNVIFIMPYQPHDSFSDYVGKVDAEELACYIRNLLKALARVHKFNFVHRDIKPSNFLYDRKNKKFLLVDFGLAHSVVGQPENDNAMTNKKRKRNVLSTSDSDVGQGATKKRLQTDFNQQSGQGVSQKENNPRGNSVRDLRSTNIILTKISPPIIKKFAADRTHLQIMNNAQLCKCYGKARTCSSCVTKKNLRALRAGTPGFRPPEVLLKLTDQNTAVDVWAAGIIMLSMLSSCFNFFSSPDDLTALAEIIVIFGFDEVKKMAGQYGRYLTCSENSKPLDLRKICCALRSRGKLFHLVNNSLKCANCKQPDCLCVCIGKPLHLSIQDEFPDTAYDLLKRLLDINPKTRISAEDALQHPFLKE